MQSATPPPVSRRHFVQRSLLLASALAATPLLRAAGRPEIRIGLSQYSLRQLLKAKTLDPLDYPAFARREFGITDIDLWEGGLPADHLDDVSYLREIRKRAADAGSNLFLLMATVLDATAATSAERASQAAVHFPALDRAAELGCRFVRIFVKAPSIDRVTARARCAESVRTLADQAKERGVIVVIEPGSSPLTADGSFLAELAREVRHPHLRLMPDFGKLRGDVYEGLRAMMPHAAVVSAKTHEFDAAGNQIDWDYFRLFKIISDSGFKGIAAIEWEGKKLPPIEGVNASKRLIERALAAL